MIKDILDLSFLSGEKRKLRQRVVLLDLTFPSGEKEYLVKAWIFCFFLVKKRVNHGVNLSFLSGDKRKLCQRVVLLFHSGEREYWLKE